MNSKMTEKSKNRRNRLNAKEDDFILADLDVMRNDEELSPVPLDHVLDDEDIIDRLLIDADFDAEDKPEQTEWIFPAVSKQASTRDFHHAADDGEIPDNTDAIDRLLINTGFDANDEQEPAHTRVVDDLNLADEDKLVVEPIEQTEQNRHTETEETSTRDFSHVAAFDDIADDEDAVDRLLVDTDFEVDNEQTQTDALVVDAINPADESGENFDERSAIASDVAIVDPETNDATTIVEAQKQISETVRQEPVMIAGNKLEQISANLNEAGITALNHNGGEQENSQKQLNNLEHKVKKTAVLVYASLAIGIIALMSTIAMAVIISGMKTEISKLTELVSILEEDMGSLTEKNSEMKFNSDDSAIEQLDQKVNGPSKQLQEQSQSATEIVKSKLTVAVTKQSIINKSFGGLQTRIHALEKKKPSEIAVKKVSAKKQAQVKKAKNTHPAEDWSVNLISYKEKSYAKTKAAKFVQKGVPVKVTAVDVNNATLYRLKVGGFKNKLDATSYASKIKKSLNLNSVSVDSNT